MCRQVAQGHVLATYHFPKYQCAILLFFLCHLWWNVNKLYITDLCTSSIKVISFLWSHLLPEIARALFTYMHTWSRREEEHMIVTRNCSFKKCWTQTRQVIHHICLTVMPLQTVDWLPSSVLVMSDSAPQIVSPISWVCESVVGFCSLYAALWKIKQKLILYVLSVALD